MNSDFNRFYENILKSEPANTFNLVIIYLIGEVTTNYV